MVEVVLPLVNSVIWVPHIDHLLGSAVADALEVRVHHAAVKDGSHHSLLLLQQAVAFGVAPETSVLGHEVHISSSLFTLGAKNEPALLLYRF
jgi:hypothetical protein